MLRQAQALSAGLMVAALVTFASAPAHAVVYCKTVGVPKGCVVRPTGAVVVAPAPAVVAAPAAAAVVATPGVGAPGVGVRAGTPMNRGGPVNRVGVR
jgi:hypothetical protein